MGKFCIEMENFPTGPLGPAISQLITRRQTVTDCPTCQQKFMHSVTTDFVTASEIILVNVQRRIHDPVTNTDVKNHRRIDVDGNVNFTLKNGDQVEYELIGAIMHQGKSRIGCGFS